MKRFERKRLTKKTQTPATPTVARLNSPLNASSLTRLSVKAESGEISKPHHRGVPSIHAQRPHSATQNDNLRFGEAFRQSRASGASEFTWRGRRYTTEMATPAQRTERTASRAAEASTRGLKKK